MQIFMPVMHHSVTVTHPVTDAEKELLVQTLREVTTGELSRLRDAFDFENGTLVARIDARRGESDFMLEALLDKPLRVMGFEPTRRASVVFEDLPETTLGSMFNIYMMDRILVIVATEVADRGRHKYHTVRFVKADPRFNLEDLH